MQYYEIEHLIGKTPVSVTTDEDEEIRFTLQDGTTVIFYHSQNCCESVWIDDICGDLEDLVGEPLTEAEEASEDGDGTNIESQTWTFYRFGNNNASVVVRWCGESNGYYSESVDIRIIPPT